MANTCKWVDPVGRKRTPNLCAFDHLTEDAERPVGPAGAVQAVSLKPPNDIDMTYLGETLGETAPFAVPEPVEQPTTAVSQEPEARRGKHHQYDAAEFNVHRFV